MRFADRLKPSSQDKRIAFDGPRRAKRCPNPIPEPSEIEIRPFYEMADFQ
jgi:hypothetical protein